MHFSLQLRQSKGTSNSREYYYKFVYLTYSARVRVITSKLV